MNAFHYEDIKNLACSMPEDIEQRKAAGDLKGTARLIDRWLTRPDLPEVLRGKLRAERAMLEILPHDYPYSFQEVYSLVKKKLPDMTVKEFLDLQDAGRISWMFLNGEERFFSDTVDTLLDDPAMKERSCRLLGEPFVRYSPSRMCVQASVKRMIEKGEDTVRFRIRHSLRIKDEAFRPNEKVRVWLPVPKPCLQIEGSSIQILTTSDNNYVLAPENAPQRTIMFETSLSENRDFFVEYEYINHSVYHDLWRDEKNDLRGSERAAVDPLHHFSKEFYIAYLSEEYPHIRFTPFMRALANEITKDSDSPLEKARDIYLYITTKVRYSYMRSYYGVENLGEYAAVNRKGDCGIQALMFITLCRICGIPARWQSGNGVHDKDMGSHDWAQFYVEPYGWLFCDPSYGGGAWANGDEVRHRFYFGNLDAFRMVANDHFQRQFTPAPVFIRSDPYDNQSGEAEYPDHALRGWEFSAKKEVLEHEIKG
jgi:transglutaminase-like putative cysteine protease